MKLDVSHRTLPMQGEHRNGDAVVVRLREEGPSLFAVIDGLGHGPNAADVAERAVAHLLAEDPKPDAAETMKRLHEALRGSRGAAATLFIVHEGVLRACGVGNVTLRSYGTTVPFVLSPGILGGRVHAFRSASTRLAHGDRIVLHSDGIASVFSLDPLRSLNAEDACARIFEERRKTSDDATVLVVDVSLGGP